MNPATSRQHPELTTHELDQFATEKDFADCMADIVIVAKQYRFLMARLGVGRRA